MKAIAQYDGKLLSHVKAVYRPGERALAIELAEALGCAITDTGFESADGGGTFLAVHPNPDDRNIQNNVFFISQMTPAQQALEAQLRRLSVEDGALRESLAGYRDNARAQPFGVAHFAFRYPSRREVDEVVARIESSLAPRLKERLNVRVFRPEDSDAAREDMIQVFLHQDIIVSGLFLTGQLIELQTQAHS
jgi:hypothetical protein